MKHRIFLIRSWARAGEVLVPLYFVDGVLGLGGLSLVLSGRIWETRLCPVFSFSLCPVRVHAARISSMPGYT